MLLSMAATIACSGGPKLPSADGSEKTGTVEAQPAPKPGAEAETGAKGEPPDYSIEGLLEDWPDDVPLLEPYEITGYLPETGGYRQVSILVDGVFDYVYDTYAASLFEENGWEPDEESKSGLPGLFLSFKCEKDIRVLSVMMKSEDDGAKTLVQLGITDVTKRKKAGN